MNALYFLNEGIIILQENDVNNYKIELCNEKALHLLNAGSLSKLEYKILNEKINDFHCDRIKCQKNIETLTEFEAKSTITTLKQFSDLTEMLSYYKLMNTKNEAFHFVRNSKISSNLKLILKQNFINKKNYFFIFIRSINNLATLAETNELKTRLISSFSHELKTPLNSTIPLLSEIMESTDTHNKELISKTLSCLKILENSLNNILDYSLILSGQYLINIGVVYIEEIMNEIEQIIKEQVELKGLIFHRENDDSLEKDQSICSDYIRLRQLLLNIILNAIHFTKKGKITLKIRVFAKDPLALEFTICDTGIGISMAKLNILKEELNSNNEIPINSTGSCLGLIVSNNIAFLLGKSGIIIDSIEKQGTSVCFLVVDQGNYEDYQKFNPRTVRADISIEKKFLEKIKAFSTPSYKTDLRNKKIMDSSHFYNSLRMINQSKSSRPNISTSRNKSGREYSDPMNIKTTNTFNRNKTFSNDRTKSIYEDGYELKFTTYGSNIQQTQSLLKSQFLAQRPLSVVGNPLITRADSNKIMYNASKGFSSKQNQYISCDLSLNEGGGVTFEEIVRNYNFDNLVRFKQRDFSKTLEIDHSRIQEDQDSEITIKSSLYYKTEKKLNHPKKNPKSTHQTVHSREYFHNSNFNEDFVCEDILIVDDDVFNLFSLEMILKNMNLTCKKATNGQEAIDILKDFKKCHEKCKGMRLVLMDYQMPVLDGVESTKEIIRIMKTGEIHEVNIIGCTAFTAKNEVLKCLEAGMKDIFFKPLNKNVLQGIINRWI